MTTARRVLVLNGPNLDRLGKRQPEIYGTTTLEQLEEGLRAHAQDLGLAVEFFQTNDEERMVEQVRSASKRAHAIVINPAALTHFSYPLRDAVAACGLPVIEVHISNIHAREPFRRLSLISPVVRGVICGLGTTGYRLALEAVAEWLKETAGSGRSKTKAAAPPRRSKERK